MSNRLKMEAGVGAFIKTPDGVLLVKKNYGPLKDRWTFPEGYVDNKENFQEALKRELKEEINASVEIKDLLAVRQRTDKKRNCYFVFDCLLKNKKGLRISSPREIKEWRFFKKTEIADDPKVYSLVKIISKKSGTNRKLRQTNFRPKELKVKLKNYLLFS